MDRQIVAPAVPVFVTLHGAGNPEKFLRSVPVFMPSHTIRERMVILLSVPWVFLVC
jgi:hypothetical protein